MNPYNIDIELARIQLELAEDTLKKAKKKAKYAEEHAMNEARALIFDRRCEVSLAHSQWHDAQKARNRAMNGNVAA